MNEIQKIPRVRVGYSGRFVFALILVIIILAGFLTYSFIIKPYVTGYVVDRQIEAQQILVNDLIARVQQQGYVEIVTGENQSLVLVPYSGPNKN